MKISIFLGTLIFFFILAACSKDEATIPTETSPEFVGIYSVENYHRTGLHPIYDDMGSTIGQEEHESTFSDSLLTIKLQANSDTLLIDGLVKGFSGNFRIEVQAVIENDSLIIKHELPTFNTHNSFIRGKIWLENDSLFLDYRWDTSDIWSTGALPNYGKVFGRGIKI